MKFLLILLTAPFVSLLLSTGCSSPRGSLFLQGESTVDSHRFTPEQARGRFIRDFVIWGQEDIGNLPRTGSLLAVGSSSIRGWHSIAEDLSPLEVVHRGFGGSRMEDVALMTDFFLRYEANTILVYEGDNDLAREGSDIEAGFLNFCRAFVEEVFDAQPETRIFFISIKPSPSRIAAMERFAEANRRLEEMCATDPRLHYIDVLGPMLDEFGQPRGDLFAADQLHMNEAGYALWTAIIRPRLIAGQIDET